jgi:hypothetical protein
MLLRCLFHLYYVVHYSGYDYKNATSQPSLLRGIHQSPAILFL